MKEKLQQQIYEAGNKMAYTCFKRTPPGEFNIEKGNEIAAAVAEEIAAEFESLEQKCQDLSDLAEIRRQEFEHLKSLQSAMETDMMAKKQPWWKKLLNALKTNN